MRLPPLIARGLPDSPRRFRLPCRYFDVGVVGLAGADAAGALSLLLLVPLLDSDDEADVDAPEDDSDLSPDDDLESADFVSVFDAFSTSPRLPGLA